MIRDAIRRRRRIRIDSTYRSAERQREIEATTQHGTMHFAQAGRPQDAAPANRRIAP